MKLPVTPECDKLLEIKEQTQDMGDFIDWMDVNNWTICSWVEGQDNGYAWRESGFAPIKLSTEKLLAQYFEIDLDKVEAEKRELLKYLRSLNNPT